MKRSGDDIIGYKSTDPNEINISTKGWSRDWFLAFNQLFDQRVTHVQSGQALPYYWSGPMNTSSSNPQYVDKWGYYYDGATNYIIDPFVHDTFFRSYQQETGVDAVINEMIHGYTDHGAKEITVYNLPIFLKKQKQASSQGYVWFSDRDILFGSYQMKDERDEAYVQAVMDTHERQQFFMTIDGKTYLKMFVPLQLDVPVVVSLTADYERIKQSIDQQQTSLLILIGTTAIIAILLVIIVVRLSNRHREATAESVQEVYVDHISSLFRSMKEQRHDFNNHVAAIHALVHLQEYEELDRYTGELIGETAALNDVIQINVPSISAIVQAKVIQSIERKINFQHHVANLSRLSLGAIKATDLVRILSNLIDNAFDAVSDSGNSSKEVALLGRVEKNMLVFEISNSGDPIPEENLPHLFKPGYSTKKSDGIHAGLGLYIVKKLVEKYGGTIQVSSLEGKTRFTIMIPV